MASPMDDISDITLPSSDEAHLPLESVSHDAKQNDSKRVVTVVTVPVKDSEVISRKITTLLIRLFGSQLTWAMHWAILVGGTAFELKRPRGRAKPYLGVSIWPDEKLKDIVTSFPLGFTTFSDEEILRAGEEYFSGTQPYYDLTVNNCQLFVLFASSKIAPTLPLQQQPIGTGGHIATILFTLPSRALLPFFILYLRWWRGVDSKNLNLFCVLFTLFISCSISTLFTLQSQVAFMIADSFLSMPPGLGAFIAFPIVLTSSLTMPAMFFLWPWLSWPRIQQKKDGRWIVTSLFHLLGIEESSFEPGPVAEETLKSVPIWILIVGGLVGALVWSSIVIPLVLRWVYNIFINHISYRSPMSFLRSIYILLTTPFVILEDEVRITVEELCPEAVGAAKQRASSRNNNS